MQERDKELVTPPLALISNNPIKWFRFFGPGAIVASLTIASGELIFSSRGGSIFGYRILWVFLVITLMKWVLAYCSMRHMILSGGHPFRRWSFIAGPRGWFPLFMFVIAVVCYPPWYSFLSGLLGTVCAWIFGIGDHYIWATVFAGAAMLLLYSGGYDFLEKAQLLILGLMLACIAVAAVYVRPDWLAVAKGALVPQSLAYPDWALEKVPQLRFRSVWVEILVYASAIGGSSFDYLGYVSFLRDKKWGLSHMGPASTEQLQRIEEQSDHPARVWVRAARVDTVASFVMIVIFSAQFSILGTVILQAQQLVPDGIDMLNYQASFLTSLSPWLLPIYQLAVFLAFFGGIYGGPELNFRLIYEYLDTLGGWRGRLPMHKIRAAFIAWSLGGGVVILWLSRLYPGVQLLDIVTPAAIYTGVLSCGFYCLANPWMDWRFLPAGLRMSAWLFVINVLAGVAFVLMGFKALWDYGGIDAWVTLLVVLLVCVLLAYLLRFLHRVEADHPA